VFDDSSLRIYDVNRDEWKTQNIPVRTRGNASAVAVNGKVLIFHGTAENGMVESYWPAMDR
jgi:hypothetical protein